MKEIIIDEEYMDMRIDRFISKVTNLSKGEVQKLLRKKIIKVNGKKKEGSYRTKNDDIVQFYLPDEVFLKNEIIKTDFNDLDIIYEDDNLIILDKSAGVLSQGDGSKKKDIASMLVSYLNTSSTGIVTRLDLNTSGIMIGGKNRRTLMLLNEMSKKNLIDKRYLTLVKGEFDKEGKVTHYGIKDEKENKLLLFGEKKEGAFEVSAFFKIKKRYKGYTLLEVNLITGKVHQIRAQLNKLGFPVVGDRKYFIDGGNNMKGLNRQFLHCYKVTLKFEEKYKEILSEDKVFYSSIPKELDAILDKMEH